MEFRAAQGQAADRAVEDQVVENQAAVGVQVVGDRVVEDRVVGDQVGGVQAADRAVEDGVAVGQRLACGPEQAAAAPRHLFLGWWPALRAEPLAGAASPQKKSSSGFSAR